MTQLTDDLITFEVPEGAVNFEVCNYGLNDTLEYDYPQGHEVSDLPPGNWQFICTTKDITEEQARGIVEHDSFIDGYKDYDTERFHHEDPFIKATDSLNSLLTSKGLDPNKNYCLLKKVEQ